MRLDINSAYKIQTFTLNLFALNLVLSDSKNFTHITFFSLKKEMIYL